MPTASRTSRGVRVVVLTGGPGGGKSVLLQRLAESSGLRDVIVTAEEAIRGMRFVRLSPHSREFQCALVAAQAATEDSLRRALQDTNKRLIISHRGTLDPCAFWQSFGNSRDSFFEMTGTTLEDHYRRYDLVLHLESAAVRVPDAYIHYPQAHRPEDVEQAVRLDRLLGELWGGHPGYVRIDAMPDFEAKLCSGIERVRSALEGWSCHEQRNK